MIVAKDEGGDRKGDLGRDRAGEEVEAKVEK